MAARILLIISVFYCSASFGQIISSVASGPWNDPNTWGGTVPNAANSTAIRILNGHVVNVPSGFSTQADQLTVRAGGSLIIDAGGVLSIVNASGNDLNIFTGSPNGTLLVSGTLELEQGASIVNTDGVTSTDTDASTVTVLSGGIYRHKYTTTGGSLMGASWQTGSTIEITGYTTNASRPANLSQSFYNFVWNCPSQSAVIDLKGGLSTVNGDLSVLATGPQTQGMLRFFASNNNATLNVSGNLLISGQSNVWFTNSGTGNTVNITGDLTVNSTMVQIIARTGSVTLNCRNFSSSSGSSVTLGLISPGQSTVNLTGDLTLGGALVSASNPSFLNFTGNSVQNLGGSGSVSKINYTIKSGAIVNANTNSIRGSGSLTMEAGSELQVGSLHAAGAIQNSTTAGNILVPVANRTYDVNATIVYNGAGSQVLAAGHPIVNTVIDTNVALMTNLLTVNDLNLRAGSFSVGSRSLNVQGDWIVNEGSFIPGTGGINFTGTTTITGSGPFTFNTFTINTAASVVMPNADVSILANFNVNTGGTINASSGTVVLAGSSTQVVRANGATLNNLTVNKSGGEVNLNNALQLSGLLLINSATIFRTYGYLTLLSTNDKPAQDGSIGPLTGGASIVGNVTVQRYMSASDNLDRFISSPVSNATVAQIQDDFSVTGDFTGTSYPCTGCNNNGASLKRYMESTLGSFNKGYTAVPATGGNNSQQLIPGVGYDSYMWNAVGPIVLDLTGTINSGTINFSVSHTPSSPAVPTADGWNLVGNPYPSAIQWNNGAGWSRTNIDATVWVWDVVGKVWQSYNANTSVGNLTNGVIALGQGFWVYAPTPGAASMSINENAKFTASDGSFYRQRSPFATLKVSLKRDESVDESFIVMHQEGDEGLVSSPKLILGMERHYVAVQSEGVAYGHYLRSAVSTDDIPLIIDSETDGELTLAFEYLNGVDFSEYYLNDLIEYRSVSLRSGMSYKFNFAKDASTSARFVLSRTPLESADSRNTVSVFPNPTQGKLTVKVESGNIQAVEMYDSRGYAIGINRSTEITADSELTLDISHLPAGVYIVRVVSSSGSPVMRRVVKQ